MSEGAVLINGDTIHKAAAAARVFHAAAEQLVEVRADADLNETLGVMAGATVLEALALELVLKARLLRAGVKPPKWHSHSDLFALLPAAEQQDADQNYQANRLTAMRATLTAVLDFSANAFERWRHHNEQPTGASLDEMQLAFNALVARL
jgi:hypothetical protein